MPGLLFVVQSIANGLTDLLPYRSVLGVSDGLFLWALFRHPAHAERWLAFMRLNADVMDGVVPERLPADFIAKAIAVRDARRTRSWPMHWRLSPRSIEATCRARA